MRISTLAKSSICAAVLVVPLALSGCGYEKPSDSNITPPPKNIDVMKKDAADKKQQEKNDESATKNAEKTTDYKLFLIDANGHVAPQTLSLPTTSAPAEQVLKYLVKGGPVASLLPKGFKAVLPEGTTFNLNLQKKDGTVVVDFSKEFLNYNSKDEDKMLQALTWTLTQFNTINHVKLQVNGKDLKEMPVGKTQISPEGLSRADGINVDLGNVVDITNSDSVIVYYLAENSKGQSYYVPVTERVDHTKDKVTAAVNALVKAPTGISGLQSPFDPNVALISHPVVKDGVVTLNFNDALFTAKNNIVNDQAVNALALTLTDQEGIKKVALEVNGKTKLTLESGKPLAEPVSRPSVFNKVGI